MYKLLPGALAFCTQQHITCTDHNIDMTALQAGGIMMMEPDPPEKAIKRVRDICSLHISGVGTEPLLLYEFKLPGMQFWATFATCAKVVEKGPAIS